MITDFDDLCLYTYVTVDDILMKIEPLLRRPRPTPLCNDSEVITMVLVAECKGSDIDRCYPNWAITLICSLYSLLRVGWIGADAI